MDQWHRLAEEKINEAQRNGMFDNLEGFGQPLIFENDDPNWWIKQKVRRERLNMLPPALILAREVERKLRQILQCDSEPELVAELEKLNQHIRQANMQIYWGPPSSVLEFEIDDIVAHWRELQS